MGGVAIRHELGSIEALENYPEACQFFKDVGKFEFSRGWKDQIGELLWSSQRI